MKDLFNRIKISPLIAPQIETGNTDVENVATPVDRLGFESTVIEIRTGTLSDADTVVSVKVYEGDASDGSDKTAVAAADLQLDTILDATPEATYQGAFDFADDNKAIKIGYLGNKRYVGLNLSPLNNSGNIPVSASVILSGARHNPAGSTQTP